MYANGSNYGPLIINHVGELIRYGNVLQPSIQQQFVTHLEQ